MNILIKNGLGHQFLKKGSSFFRQDILIQGDTIAFVGDFSGSGTGEDIDRVIDADNCLVLPGLVNAHIHSHDHFNKGAYDNLPLELYLLMLRPLFTGLNHSCEEIYLRTLYGCIELLKTGCTTVMDDIIFNPLLDEKSLEAVFKAYREAGIRVFAAHHILNKPLYESLPFLHERLDSDLKQKLTQVYPPEDEILDFIEGLIRKHNGREGLQNYALSASGPQRCSLKLMRGMRELSEKYRVPMFSHVLETKLQREAGKVFFGRSLVEYLDNHDLLFQNFSLIHSIWVEERDLSLMARGKCKVVHNPGSNLKLGSGIAPVPSFLDYGIPVALGTDNLSANDSLNMFEAMKLAGLIHKIGHYDYRKWIGAREAFEMATLHGACCLLREDSIGSIEVGKKADIIILDMENERFIPTNEYLQHLVFCESGSSIKTVLVNGRIVVGDGRIQTFDEEEVLREVKKIMPGQKEQQRRAVEESRSLVQIIRQVYEEFHSRNHH